MVAGTSVPKIKKKWTKHQADRPTLGRPAWYFVHFFLIFGTLVPATTTHPKLVALVRNKQNVYGTWCEACVIPEKLTVKIGNNGRQHSSPAVPGALQYFCYQGCITRCNPAPSVSVLSLGESEANVLC